MELIEAHEELKETVIQCLNNLIGNCSINIIELFYTRKHAALLSHGIYLCVTIARLEKSISLRLSAIRTIMTLLQVQKEAETQDVDLRNKIAYVIMLYLPGIASGLLEIAVGNDIQNHKITMMAIRVWSKALNLVMQDMLEEESKVVPLNTFDFNNIKSKDLNTIEKIKHILKTSQRTPDWYAEVSEKLKIILVELNTLTKHSHYKVRKELVEGVSLILLNCSRNMKSCFQILLNILITMSEDENEQVAKKARNALQNIQDKFHQDKSMKSIVEMLEENLYDLLTEMPRIIRTSTELLQLMWLDRLAGYLKLFGKQRLSLILLSTAHLRKLLLSLIYITELDSSSISLLEDISTIDFDDTVYHEAAYSWKQHKFLFNSTCVEKLNCIFRILGEFGDHKLLVDSILKMILELPKFKKELILMLNVILGVSTDSSVQISIYKQVIEFYTTSDYWDLPIEVSEEITLHVAQNNIVQCCLLLEGLGIIAKVLQEKYQDFLLKTLYIVIERAGNKHSLLRSLGLSTLEIITTSQKLNTVGDLFRVNCDYISYHVTVKLRRVERNPGVLNVVEVVTKYSTMDFLPQLKEIVYDLLLQSGSNIQKRNTLSFLKVFYAFVICIKRLTSKSDSENKHEPKCLKPSEIVINNFLQYYNSVKDSKLYENENNDCDTDENVNNISEADTNADFHRNSDFSEDEKEAEVPYFITMIKDIMKHCLHFLPSSNFNESSLAISILKEGAFILKESENVLLPIVHELWHPLIHRFQNSNPLIMNQAFQLLCCLCQVSQDFIRSRTLKQILPQLSNFLTNSAKESYKKNSRCIYKYTQTFKLQREILSQLGFIVKNLKLFEKDTWDILETVEPYLDSSQHQQLQEYCVNLYKDVSDYNTDLVWMKCIDIWHRHVETVVPVCDYSEWYSKAMDFNGKNNYYKNIQQILTYIRVKRERL
ncbi:PREDICTED: TELO2-interacting protein 1 homolog [Ceratosolen solmsi marchali]|uniref:TELO2-interacting protein 1 homolog n=1 Tax=Ceratosolen solmsi marchali TaxID=326594 RepID=A0AAJ7E1V2_9HYME|nr:PREDICTED: TELO2-interacting protein 1 homolog [Ceratosolen solmsi marchali]